MYVASFQPLLASFQQYELHSQVLLSDVMGTLSAHPLDASRDLLLLLERAPLRRHDGRAAANAGLSYLQSQAARSACGTPVDLLGQIGRGCFGGVFLARDSFGQEVALKIYHPPFNESREGDIPFRGLLNELRFQAVIDNQSIVRVLRCGLLEGARPYLALEYMPQGSLADRLRLVVGEETAPEEILGRIWDLTERMLLSAATVHAAGIFHGDIGLGNFLVDAQDRVKLSDFAFARRVEEAPYACELYGKRKGLPQGVLDDVFQLGKAAYQLATLYPYDLSDLSIERAPAASRKRPDLNLPGWVDDLVTRAVGTTGKDRFQNAGEMLEFLRSHR